MISTSHDIVLDEGARTLHVESAGSGRDIVLIHGARTTHTDWMGDLFDGFARRGRVLAVDRPGHGGSLRPRLNGSPHLQAAQIREALQRLGVERPLLIGHSFGALVASAWAAAHPDEVSGLVLVSPIAFPEFRPLEHPMFGPRAVPVIGPMLAKMAEPTLDRAMLPVVKKIMFAPDDPPPAWLERYPDDQILAASVSEGEDAAAILPSSPLGLINYFAITAPVRMLIGQRDHVIYPLKHARRLACLLPEAQVTARFDSGHMFHHSASDTLFAVVDELLGLRDVDRGHKRQGRRGAA
jgi:pimeloyl-ACP methyl ester carboxylesterase